MRIYFSGSIRGASADRNTYRLIVDRLKRYGKVLTEHVAKADESDEIEIDDREIFKQDLEWLKSSDVLVAEVTAPSHGVGYEIGKAEECGIPVLCLYNDVTGRHLSAMINGNDYLTVRRYRTDQEAVKIIEDYFSSANVRDQLQNKQIE